MEFASDTDIQCVLACGEGSASVLSVWKKRKSFANPPEAKQTRDTERASHGGSPLGAAKERAFTPVCTCAVGGTLLFTFRKKERDSESVAILAPVSHLVGTRLSTGDTKSSSDPRDPNPFIETQLFFEDLGPLEGWPSRHASAQRTQGAGTTVDTGPLPVRLEESTNQGMSVTVAEAERYQHTTTWRRPQLKGSKEKEVR